jgi:hypothetical protein
VGDRSERGGIVPSRVGSADEAAHSLKFLAPGRLGARSRT